MKRKHLLRRLLQAFIVLIGVTLLIFVMLRIVPGNPVETMMGEHADAATVARMTAEMGLDQPLYVQFFRYVSSAVTGDFGTSYSMGKPVSRLMGAAFVNTLILALFAALFAWVVGLACGIVSALKKNRLPDRLFMGFSLLGISLPVFMAAMFLQYVFAFQLHWLPISGTDNWTGFILPAVALGWNSAGQVAQITRSALLETLQEDYIDTARAKGRGTFGILMRHALRNAMLPVLTMMNVQFSSLLSGAVITETVFSINGIGRLMVTAISGRDLPLLQGTALLATTVVILGSLAADCLYSVLDPRIRKEG
jgi:peptide/nickel transport system permease protein